MHFLAQTAGSPGGGGFAIGGAFLILVLLIGLATLALWIWALVDILGSNKQGVEKIVWLLAIFFFPVIGAVIYLAVGRSNRLS